MSRKTNEIEHDLTIINPETTNPHTVFALTHFHNKVPLLFVNSTAAEPGVFLTELQAMALQTRIREFLVHCENVRYGNV